MKVKKGDSVLIISGKDKGRVAKILKSIPKQRMILVEGMNLKSKHVRPKKQGEKGQVVKMPLPIQVSNAKFLCPKCGKASRLGYKIDGDKKFRICKKCKSEV
ncbi:MAG: 50S ribosomal protein L24 [Candidatus Staskawiczbacteria bacterium RIFCSPHIGHO2_02_FULL_43_16]|uniref:Large ribosomal subunit protein uL24 n=1 Tax=Candidatus Staskawiczbacteria bacterium RIFCSPHIGHO2_01_FULL_41_41 TaxID=1802203 RepID=A0A1G2HSG3_9BACT|nr:MAG: 50S ribosomal protein L24 [Candidatus Staskawiczbacteria bacterium RIFCSPHIGHO2_01_FULL_41_41]OGZ68266.1 MAG: 50S ribosomal protein L24 [Candidatus Staskawiczbacteria bacterium RIFCSPHIGHO2_02_FULL_43_16]OGZ74655.1 MAG: 50S ribosomal protein L24 [Candidatus Staskawiczbacteria bacterium RIFCSPLOWO2_01_FULL_43_17b]